jgi:nicotinamidase-related amidase
MKNILIIDMQKGFITQKNEYLIEKISNYLKNNKFDNIIATKFIENNSQILKKLNWTGFSSKEDQELFVDLPKTTKIIDKNIYGLTPKHINFIKSLGISEIEVCGVDLDACVLATAFDLFDNNISPIILSELCDTSSLNIDKKSVIEIMKRQFGVKNIK